MQTVYILIVLLGLLLAALFGGDGIHAQAQYRVYLPMVETSVEFRIVRREPHVLQPWEG
jgi:hypothetical protein